MKADLEQAVYDAITLLHLIQVELATKLGEDWPSQGGHYGSGLVSLSIQVEQALLEGYKEVSSERRRDTTGELSQQSRNTLALCCAQQRVETRDFIQAILEQALDSAASDGTLAPTWARQARALAKRRKL